MPGRTLPQRDYASRWPDGRTDRHATAASHARRARTLPGFVEAVVVELEQVVRGRDEPPFASAGRSASALEASDRAVELDLAEHGLDGDLALAVEGAPVGSGQHA